MLGHLGFIMRLEGCHSLVKRCRSSYAGRLLLEGQPGRMHGMLEISPLSSPGGSLRVAEGDGEPLDAYLKVAPKV
jgi:hypothetical protein